MKLHPLTLEQLARMADAVLADPHVSAADLARELGTNRATTWEAVDRIRRAGGWFTPIIWTTCIYCGKDLARPPARPHPRRTHPACSMSWETLNQRRRDAAMPPERAADLQERKKIANRVHRRQRLLRLPPKAQRRLLAELQKRND